MDIFDLYAKIDIDTKEFKAGLKKAEAMAKDAAEGIGKVLGGINSVGETAFKVFSASATAAGAAFTGVIKSCIEEGAAFESQMSKVKAISGASTSEMEALTEKAQEMGIQTKFSATEAGQAYEYMAMAGWKTGEMLDGIAGIMNLSAASGEDLALVSDIVTDAMTAFGLSAQGTTKGVANVTHFADVLAAASSNANTNVGMMGETFKYVAPLAGTLGYSIEDAAEAIGLIANAGIKSTIAGTSLRQIITRLSTDAGGSSQSLGALGTLTEKLGVEFYDTTGKARPFKKVIDEARVAWKKLNDQEKTEIATKIAGQEAISAWSALMNASEADVEKLSEAIADCDGEAQKMADTMMNNLSGAFEYLRSSAGQFKLTVYEYMKQPLTDLAKSAKESLDEVTAAFQTGGLSGAVGTAGNILGDAFSEGFRQAASFDISGVNNAIGASANGISGWLSANSENINGTIENAVSVARNGFGGFVNIASTAAKEFGGTIVSGIIDFKGDIFSAGMELIGSLAKGIDNDADKIAKSTFDAIDGGLKKIDEELPKVISAGSNLLDKLAEGLEENKDSIKGKATSIIETLSTGFTKENGQNIAGIAIDLIDVLGEALVNNLGNIGKSAGEFIGGVFDKLGEKIEETNWKELGKKIGDGIFDGIKGVSGGAWSGIARFLDLDKSALGWADKANKIFGLGLSKTDMYKNIRKEVDEGSAIMKFVGIDENSPYYLSDAELDELEQLEQAAQAGDSKDDRDKRFAELEKTGWGLGYDKDTIEATKKRLNEFVDRWNKEHSPSYAKVDYVDAYLDFIDEELAKRADEANARRTRQTKNYAAPQKKTVSFAESAQGRGISSLANTIIAMQNASSTQHVIYLTLDGETVAEVAFDPLNGVSDRRDKPLK